MVEFRENARAASGGKSGKTIVGRFRQVNPTVQVFKRKPKPDAAGPAHARTESAGTAYAPGNGLCQDDAEAAGLKKAGRLPVGLPALNC